MRSRCAGSMFAWILNTKPLNFGWVGSRGPSLVWREVGAGASSRKASRKGRTPKFVIALPKNMGVMRPASLLARSNTSPPMSSSSMSSRSCASWASGTMSAISGESMETLFSSTSLSP